MSAVLLRFINDLPPGTIWVTQQVLDLDDRNRIDKCHSRLVDAGEIVRLAQGVYYKPDWRNPRRVTDEEIAAAKGMAFGKAIIPHPHYFAQELGIKPDNNGDRRTDHRWFQVDGPSSQFQTINGTTIHFHGASKRKMRLGASRPGQTLRALWHIGMKNCPREKVEIAIAQLNQRERLALGRMSARIPVWLAGYLATWREEHRRETLRRWQIKVVKRHHRESLDKTPFASNLCRSRDFKGFSHW